MARRSILDEEDDPVDINLSSMIDCIFILLIFFIVTTVFVDEKGLAVNKPDAAASVSLEKNDSVVLDVTAENEILLDGKPVELSDVPAYVKSRIEGPETPVVLRVNGKASHGTFVSVWDAARRGGAETLSFNTVD